MEGKNISMKYENSPTKVQFLKFSVIPQGKALFPHSITPMGYGHYDRYQGC